MDFFERQGAARRRTGLLILGFVLAVTLVVLAVDAVIWGVLRLWGDTSAEFPAWLASPTAWLVTGIVLATILGTSIYRSVQLAYGGGVRVARLMGGERVDPDHAEGQAAVLVNVVEEMAIASGVTVPEIYLLDDEQAINAFAAGNHPANAVIAVTRGLLDSLDRDALQGVIAHEFSHILNGDMRMNIRLIGLLAGMSVLTEIGAAPWRAMAVDRSYGHRHRHGGGHPIVLVAGVALIVIGWLGFFAGRLVKAAVSRQREFLADAAAVQFTRNPDGLGSALLAIHQAGGGSRLRASHAEEISHMGFGRTVGGISGLTATHPSIETRMQALGPKYELWFRQGERDRRRREREEEASKQTDPSAESGGAGTADAGTAMPLPAIPGGTDAVETALSGAALAALAGQLDGTAVDHARRLLRRLPTEVLEALHSPDGAADAVAALMLHGPDTRERDLAVLPAERRETVSHLRLALEADCPGPDAANLDPAIRLPVIELALRSLRQLDTPTREALLGRTDAQIRADGRISLFEYAARTLLRHELLRGARSGIGMDTLAAHRADAGMVMSLLAHAGGGDKAARAGAHSRAMQPLFGDAAEGLLALDQCDLKHFSAALEGLATVQPIGKRSLLTACGDCIAADGVIRPAEAELIRTIAAVLDTPIPPLAPPATT